MSDRFTIRSHKGPYSVEFLEGLIAAPARLLHGEPHFLIDATVARIYAQPLRDIVGHPNAILIEATEKSKSLEQLPGIIQKLLGNKVRKTHSLVAIGGGIIQDITCFIASVLLRGIAWRFVPTTLLAQADSCIGSKSSINIRDYKNILGGFYPPSEVLIDVDFLPSLEPKDIHSGIGEILKVHAIDGAKSFDRLAKDFDSLASDQAILLEYIRRALSIKTRFIEEDEFDRGIRNIFNYGHSFGHAIESATHFAVPHGIAVTMGMDMANGIAVRRRLLPRPHYDRMHQVLRKNYAAYAEVPIPAHALMAALMKDKKNTSTQLGLIFPVGDHATVQRVVVDPDETFRDQCSEAIAGLGGE